MTNEQLFREALEAIRDANLDDCCPPRSLQEVAAGALRRATEPSAPMKAIPFESGVTYYVCMHQPPEHMRRTQCPLCDI